MSIVKFLSKTSNSTIGLLQTLGLILYCALIAAFFYVMTKSTVQPGFFGFFLMLMLLVFSAAVSGSLVFGYAAYLAVVKHKIEEGLTILSYTLLYTLGIILITTILIISLA